MRTKVLSEGNFILSGRRIFGADPRDSPLQLKVFSLLVLNPDIFLCPSFRKTSYNCRPYDADGTGHNPQSLRWARAQPVQQQNEGQTRTHSVLPSVGRGRCCLVVPWAPERGQRHCGRDFLREGSTVSVCISRWGCRSARRSTDTNYTSLSSKAVRAVHQRVKLSSLFALFLGSGQLRSSRRLMT